MKKLVLTILVLALPAAAGVAVFVATGAALLALKSYGHLSLSEEVIGLYSFSMAAIALNGSLIWEVLLVTGAIRVRLDDLVNALSRAATTPPKRKRK